MTKMSDFKH